MQLKEYFGVNLAKHLAVKLVDVYPTFDTNSFIRSVDKEYRNKELKDRVKLISDSLYLYLPNDYIQVSKIFKSIMGPENPNETGMFTEYYWLMPIAKYVEDRGLDNFDTSMELIYEITKRNTGEYAIRPYINAYPELTVRRMQKWSKDKNFHVRRLSSEGLRPKLPWATKLNLFIDDPTPVFKILTTLKADPIRFVQKSVANHLTDYLKLNKQATLSLIQEWRSCTKESAHTQWIIKHATKKISS